MSYVLLQRNLFIFYTFFHYCYIWRAFQLNNISVLIFSHSSNEEGWDPAKVLNNYVVIHLKNIFDAADNLNRIEQEVNTVDELRQMTAPRRYYGHQKVPAQLNEREFDVT